MATTDLGSIKISVVGDLSQATSALASFSKAVSSSVAQVGAQLKQLGAGFANIETLVGAAFAGKSLEKFKGLDDAFGKLRRGLGLTSAEFEPVRKTIVEFATESNTALVPLVETMSKFEFATKDVPTLLGLAKTAAQAAKLSFVETGVAADALNTVMQSFKIPLSDAARIMSQLDQASRGGRAGLDSVASGLSRIAPQAAVAGLKFEEVLAVLGSLADQTGDAAEAAAKLRVVLTKLDGIDAASKAGQRLNEILGQTAQQSIRTQGLVATLQRLAGAADGIRVLTDQLDQGAEALQGLSLGERSASAIARILAESSTITANRQKIQAATAEDLAAKYRDQKTSVSELAKETGKLISNAVLGFFERNREAIASTITAVNNFVKTHKELIVQLVRVGVALSAYAIALSGVKFVLSGLGTSLIAVSDAVKLFTRLISGNVIASAIEGTVSAVSRLSQFLNIQAAAAKAAAAANAAYAAATLRANLGAAGIGVVGGRLRGPGGQFAAGVNGATAAETAAVAGGTASALRGGALAAGAAPILSRMGAIIAGIAAPVAALTLGLAALTFGIYKIGEASINASEGASKFTLELQRLRGARIAGLSESKQADDLIKVNFAADQLRERYDSLAASIRTVNDANATADERAAAARNVQEQTAQINAVAKANLSVRDAIQARITATEELIAAGRRAFVERGVSAFDVSPVSTAPGPNQGAPIGPRPTREAVEAERARLEVKARGLSQDDAIRQAMADRENDEAKLAKAVDDTTESLNNSRRALKEYDDVAQSAALAAGGFAASMAAIKNRSENSAAAVEALSNKFKGLGLDEGQREVLQYDEALATLTKTLSGINDQAAGLIQLVSSTSAPLTGDVRTQFEELLKQQKAILEIIERVKAARADAVGKAAAEEEKKRGEALADLDRLKIDTLQKQGKLREADDAASRARHAKELARAKEIRDSKIKGAAEIAAALTRAADDLLAAELKANAEADKKRRESTEAYAKIRQEQEREIVRAEQLATAVILKRRAEEARARGDLRTERDLRDQITAAIKESNDARAEAADSEEAMIRAARERLDLLKQEVETQLRLGKGSEGAAGAIGGGLRDIAGASDAAGFRGAFRERLGRAETAGGARELFGIVRTLIEAEFRALQDQLGRTQDPEARAEIQKKLADVQERARIATEELARALKEISNRGPAPKTPLVVDPRRLGPGETQPPGTVTPGATAAAPVDDDLSDLTPEERQKLLRAQASGNETAFNNLKAKFLKRHSLGRSAAVNSPPPPEAIEGGSSGGEPGSPATPPAGGLSDVASIVAEFKGAIDGLKVALDDNTAATKYNTDAVLVNNKIVEANTDAVLALTKTGPNDLGDRITGRSDGGG